MFDQIETSEVLLDDVIRYPAEGDRTLRKVITAPKNGERKYRVSG